MFYLGDIMLKKNSELEKILLSIGGERVVLLPEPNLNSILNNDGRNFR